MVLGALCMFSKSSIFELHAQTSFNFFLKLRQYPTPLTQLLRLALKLLCNPDRF